MLWLVMRNLSRNRVRLAIALSAIAFGVAALLVAGGFIEWIFMAIRESYIKSLAGHIQVVRPGYITRGAADPYRFLLPEPLPGIDYIEKLPGVSVVTPRLSFTGLASHGDVTVSFVAEGVDAEKEKEASRYLIITDGQSLASSDEAGIVVGAGLAEQLGVKAGDTVVLLVNTPAGGISEILRYQLKGPPGMDLIQLKTIQDWVVERKLRIVPGVADVAVLGGKTKEYQAEIDLDRMRAYGLTLPQIISAISTSNSNVGGRTITIGEQSVNVRGVGALGSVNDIDNVVITQHFRSPAEQGGGIRELRKEVVQDRLRCFRIKQFA